MEELDACPSCGSVVVFEKGWLSIDYTQVQWVLPVRDAIRRRLRSAWLPATAIAVTLFAFVFAATRDIGKAAIGLFSLPVLLAAGQLRDFVRNTENGQYTHRDTVNRLSVVRKRCPDCGYRFEERSFAFDSPLPERCPRWQRVEGWHRDEVKLASDVLVLAQSPDGQSLGADGNLGAGVL